MCDTIANGDPEAVTAYVARFMTRLLRTITTETQVQTRAATPMLGANSEAVAPQPTWLTDIASRSPFFSKTVACCSSLTDGQSDFIRSTEPDTSAPWDQSIDDQFW